MARFAKRNLRISAAPNITSSGNCAIPVAKSLRADTPGVYRDRVPGDQLAKLFGAPAYVDLLLEIISSPAFERLRDIRFLGAIDYLIVPNGSSKRKRHTRYEHSLHVARLAREYSHRCGLPENDEKHLVVAALLHDIGHGPLSHSLEPVFRDRFHLTHHEATTLIINGTVPVGSALPNIFKRHGVRRDSVIALINGRSRESHAEALRNPINVDTIEAISRAHGYLSTDIVSPGPDRIVEALVNRDNDDVAILDAFWQLKDTIYDQLINSKPGVVADFLCREYMRRNPSRFWSGNYFITESALRKEHPVLFTYLSDFRASARSVLGGDSTTIEYEKRRFYVDRSAVLSDVQSLYRRYRQERIQARTRVGDVFGTTLVSKTAKTAPTTKSLFDNGE